MPIPVETTHEPRKATTMAMLLAGVVLAPLVPLVAQEVLYARVGSDCRTADRVELVLIAAGALVAVAVCAWLTYAGPRRDERTEVTSMRTVGRARFLSHVGLLLCAISALLLVAYVIPVLMLRPCDA